MAIKVMASRINLATRGINCDTPYGVAMDELSKRIFTEVVRATDSKSMKVVRIMSAEPWEQMEHKTLSFRQPYDKL